MPRPILATIDLNALRSNLEVVRRAAPQARAFAVVKANAYGHGLLRAARAFATADGFATLEIDSAVRLREAGYRHRILLLEGAFDTAELRVAADLRLGIAIHAEAQIGMLRDLPSDARLDVFLKLNSGMNRLGIPLDRFGATLAALREESRVGAITLMTHFACADDERGVAEQWERFSAATQSSALSCTVANSAAILRHPQTHSDWVRPGIMLYGGSPFADVSAEALGLRPAMTLSSRIIGCQHLAPGDAVGYGATFVAQRATRIGVVACGYADGYPRHAPSGTPVLVDGMRTATVGRVSMDMLCVDLTDIPAAGPDSRVTLWGEGLPADEVAAYAGTLSYELFCALAPRVPVTETE
jgi:alanine racemase